MDYLLIIVSIVILIMGCLYIFFYKLNKTIYKTERKIQNILKSRADLIPGLFEISNNNLVKHSNIFEEILKLRKLQFSLSDYSVSFIEFIKNEMDINHEIQFIYGICSKNKKINTMTNFVYIKNLIIERNKIIGDEIEKYKKSINFFNNIVKVKNYTIIGLLVPISKKIEFELIKNIF